MSDSSRQAGRSAPGTAASASTTAFVQQARYTAASHRVLVFFVFVTAHCDFGQSLQFPTSATAVKQMRNNATGF
ncbi:MAG: hypothetical protein RQ736_07590 [Thiogranum sp.]|nr:hypothetical protein [Thiogranum sp.]